MSAVFAALTVSLVYLIIHDLTASRLAALLGSLTLAFSSVVPAESRRTVQLLGGNFAFFGFLVGWLAGSIRRRAFEH